MGKLTIYFVFSISVLFLASACSKTSAPASPVTLPDGENPTSTPSPTPLDLPSQSRIEDLLARVPLEYADLPVGFGDWASARSLQAGIDSDDPVNFQTLSDSYEESKWDFYEGLQSPPVDPFRMNINLIGLEEPGVTLFDLGVWFYTYNSTGPWGAPHFLNMEGRLPQDQMVTALLELGYQELEYKGSTYYALNEDYTTALRHPLRMRSYPINRVAFMDDQFLAASATELITSLIDVQDGSAASLGESQSHVSLVRAGGAGLLSGVFHPYAEINPSSGISIPEKFLSGPDKWQPLSPYDLTLTGYRLRDGVDEIVVALFYPDPLAADKDVPELVHRWGTWTIDLQQIYKNFPVTVACAPLTTEVFVGNDFSVLAASCPVKRSPEHGLFNLQSSRLWQFLQPWLLAQDPAALAHAYETRPTPTPTPSPVPVISHDQAIELALGRITQPTEQFSAMENPRNPIAVRMTKGEAYELLHWGDTGRPERLVWVVQFEGEFIAEDPFSPDEPIQYHYAIEVVDAVSGSSVNPGRWPGPFLPEGE